MNNNDRLKRFTVPAMAAVTASILMSTGCMGHMGLTQKVKKGNLSITENRYGREGVFLGFQIFWVYRVSTLLDLIVFNSVEFWSGENPLTDQPALVNIDKETIEKVFGEHSVDMAQIERINETEAKMYMAFTNGDTMTFDVVRSDAAYTVSYQGREFYTGQINDAAGLVKEEV
ncbi:DUF3332 family protein [Pontiella sulfatireligans]|uniref:DUF3332 domain-containing protein n=1 Tax=Pontiella sulfatireligans TaxID=2750658 RepID=A0A6C2UWF9_9BACT|nr:DUF3332 family protein [Pontiella sulfatireligans]VGO23447.1 hypothetical protein SCARR_05554 [Pontiella sulfatireligans]